MVGPFGNYGENFKCPQLDRYYMTWMVGPFGNYGESFNMFRAEQNNLWRREWVQKSSLIFNPRYKICLNTYTLLSAPKRLPSLEGKNKLSVE